MENNKTLRIRTNIKEDQYITVNLEQEYDILEILSMKIDQKGAYKYSVGDYGVVVGRVLANNGFGVPNAKLSLFIPKNETNDIVKEMLYPYDNTLSKDDEGRRYNLLPDSQKDDCHRVVGSFPNKRVMLDDKSILEVFEEYYRYTTCTNDAGDYMFYGVPTGTYTLHMDLDISDCGKLSQRPRDFIYKGYTVEQFENPNQFKVDTEMSSLAQIFTQDGTVEVKPFWGDANDSRQVGITRYDIDVAFKFEPTCVFMGSVFTDGPSEGISQKCKPSKRMGEMSELTTGPGTIQIIRKTPANTIEELQIKGTQLIDGNGVWCFQIPMNLDYMMTDEYGNMVPTDSPEKGIPTRCEVRFRLSLEEGSDVDVFHNSKVLIPHNPQNEDELDYTFGSRTKDVSFKSLMWNNVYTIKSFIPRFQRRKKANTDNFTGIKKVNHHRGNNPMPYNNIRIEMPFMFHVMCMVIKTIISVIKTINLLKTSLMTVIGNLGFIRPYSYVSGFCPELDYWYFAPGMNTSNGTNGKKWQEESVCLTFKDIASQIGGENGEDNAGFVRYYQYIGDDDRDIDIITPEEYENLNENDKKDYQEGEVDKVTFSNLDSKSIDYQNMLKKDDIKIYLTASEDYLMQCIETNLAQEYEVIKFDFYNDWINGSVYVPQWKGSVKYRKKRKNGEKILVPKIKGCMNDPSIFKKTRYYVQQCSLSYDDDGKVTTNIGCHDEKLRCHNDNGRKSLPVFGERGGIVHDGKTSLGDSVYYLKPYEFNGDKMIPFFATDIVMLGSLFDCNEYGLPSTFSSLMSTTYQLPPSLAQTNLEEDGDSYSGDGITLNEIKALQCNHKTKGMATGRISGGVQKQNILTYSEIEERLKMYSDVDDTQDITIEYDDVFPITEVSGIDWGYEGAGYKNSQGLNIGDSGKILAPGGHFLGMSCWNAETNIRSCVNLKRACEIGTTLSERIEIPVGYSTSSDGDFEITNYLFIAPNGLIAKDQILDTTFRSAFATMNQNSLRTVVNSYGYKEYDFQYLLPDSFDGCLSDKITSEWTQKLNMDELFVSDSELKEIIEKYGIKNDVIMESGNTIIRSSETRSDDYVRFRMGDKPRYLREYPLSKSMPVYKNSFYFYFGLKKGATALDVFKSQYYAPCAPQVLSQPKGEMLLTVERPEDIDMLNKFYFNLKFVLKGMEKNSVKRFVLYRLYTDDYHIIKSKGSTENKEIESFDVPKASIEGQFTGNEYILENVPFGVYEVVLGDEYGNEIVDSINIGEGFIKIAYNKNEIVHYVKTIANDSLQNDGLLYNEKNPLKLGNGGYIHGDFTIEGVPDVVKYRIVIKRVDGYAPDKFRQFECVKNGDNRYQPNINWYSWFDNKGKRLYLWGYGNYEVWIRSMDENGYVCEFKYDTFVVNDGVALSFSLGDKNLGLGTISYDMLYKLESKYGEWWNKSETFSESNDLLSDDEKYVLYRTITDYSNFEDSKGVNLNIKYIGDESGVEILYGEGSMMSGDTWVVKQNELMLQTNNATNVTAADEGYVLNTTTIHNALNEEDEKYSRNYPLLYVNVDEEFKTWGNVFCDGTLINGIFDMEKGQDEKYHKIINVLGDSEIQRIFLLYNKSKEEFYLVNCKIKDGQISVTLNKRGGYSDDMKLGNGKYTLIHLSKLPIMRKPFKYVGIVVRGVNTTTPLILDNAFVNTQTVSYNIKAKGENRFIISVSDYNKYIGNDIYNNITHNFTPTNGKHDFTTYYNGENIVNRDETNGSKGVLLEIPISYLDNVNEKEKLYSLLKNKNKDEFVSGSIKPGHYLCQVFMSQNSVNGVFYYVLKLGKNGTDTIG